MQKSGKGDLKRLIGSGSDMVSLQTRRKRYLDHVVIAGGGRWARVLTEALDGLLPPSSRATVYSPHCADSMADWACSKGLQARVAFSSKWPRDQINAVIVANAARDHFKVASRALSEGIPVLVEKPVALSLSDANTLHDIAKQNRVRFAPAHVFLFATYLEQFSRVVSVKGNILQIRIEWSDPCEELRYGEEKSYDPSLPVYADWIPHIVSILSSFIPVMDCRSEHVKFFEGGQRMEICLRLGSVLCQMKLARNAKSRQRLVKVETDSDTIGLDFSTEPGTISSIAGSGPETASLWAKGPRPVPLMLDSFNAWVLDDVDDSRFDANLAIHACEVIEQIEVSYLLQQKQWLYDVLRKYDGHMNHDLFYCLAEVLQRRAPLSADTLASRLDVLKDRITGLNRSFWLQQLDVARDHREIILELVANQEIKSFQAG